MAGAAACSSSSAAPPSKKLYDVFISFRGEDTRRNFTSHLHAALCRNHFRTFKDNIDIEKGDETWPVLVHAIDNSYLCIVVFSKHYASSTWCLKELTHILERKKDKEVIPVFYQIDPSDIRRHTGSYKDAFNKHEENLELDKETIKKWKTALKKAANISGFDSESKDYRDDNCLIENMLKDICQKLEHFYPRGDPKGLVGIDEICTDIQSLLKNVQVIGLWGMGGIGKTTIARVLFNRYSSEFMGHCFLDNVNENSGKLGHGLRGLRERLFSKLLKEQVDIESELVKKRLSRMKVFIVLDDVKTPQQIEELLSDISFVTDSRIIITTREKLVLNRSDYKIHEVKGLAYQESFKLFCLNAFEKDHPQEEFQRLSERAVRYASGLPLALKLLGSILRSKTEEIWESTLKKLKTHLHPAIDNVLRLSYDELEDEEKEIFLDIAFFFKGERKKYVENFLKACNFHATSGLDALQNKALITISDCGEVEMHDLIQEMGWKIVHKECKDPGRRSRLKDPTEICDVLKNNEGSDAIEGIILDLSQIQIPQFNGDPFKKMTKLRLLNFFDYNLHEPCTGYHFGLQSFYHNFCKGYHFGLQSLSHNLRYFRWDACILESLPSTLCYEKIVELHIENGKGKSFGDKVHDLTNLRRINLKGCENLMKFPDLSKALNLESIDLSYCKSLHHVPAIFCAKNLVHFIACHSSIKKLWDGAMDLVSLKEINLRGCVNLMEFPDLSKALNLESINLSDCKSLHHVPTTFYAKNLVRFIACHISVNKLWDGVMNLVSLKEINLSRCCNLIELPDLSKALNLKLIRLQGCKNLKSLRSEVSLDSISVLDVEWCPRLREISLSSLIMQTYNLTCAVIETSDSSIRSNLQSLLPNKSRIKSLPNELSYLRSLSELDLSYSKELDTGNLHIILEGLFSMCSLCLQGSNVEILPACIKYLPFLQRVEIFNCKRLRSILGLPLSLKELNADDCESLETIITPTTSTVFDVGTSFLFGGLMMSFKNCAQLNATTTCAIASDARKRIMVAAASQCDHPIQLCFPGSEVPSWCRYHAMTSLITIELPLCSVPLGFAFSLVLSLESSVCYGKFNPVVRIECKCSLEDSEIVTSKFQEDYWGYCEETVRIPDHIILWYDEIDNETIIKAIRESRAKNTHYNPKISFEFFVWVRKYVHKIHCKGIDWILDTQAIKECGVWPIHTSEIEYSAEEMEECLELGGDMHRPPKKLKPSFLAKRLELELELGNKSYNTSGIGVAGSQVKHFTETNFDCLHQNRFSESDIEEYEVCSVYASSESQNSIDEKELALEANQEQQLLPIINFKESTFQPIAMGLELEINSESKTYLDNNEIEVEGSNQEIQENQEPLPQTEEFIFQLHRTPTKMLNDDKDPSETFSCVCIVGFLWERISRLFSSS